LALCPCLSDRPRLERTAIGCAHRTDRQSETWIAYLSGLPVDETTAYNQLKTGHARAKPAAVLADHCTQHRPLANAPPSLIAACTEWALRLADLR